jgi:hypothetical protein
MRILAAIVLTVLAAVVVGHQVTGPGRDRARAEIAGTWDLAAYRPETRVQLLERVERYLERFGDDPEERWFAARAFLKVDAIDRAIDAVWEDEALAAAPGTARRFGRMLLTNLGFLGDEDLTRQRPAAAQVSLVLAEGGDEGARAFLDEHIANRLQGGLLDVLYGTFLYSTRDTVHRVARALRKRGEHESHVVAAMAAMGPDAYEERDADLAKLEESVESHQLRQSERIVWGTAAVSLGRSEDARGLDVLAMARARLASTGEEIDRLDAGTLAASLLAGGRWEMLDPLSPYLGPEGPLSRVRAWYGEALLARIAAGDSLAPAAFTNLWGALQRYPDPPLLARLATGLLLRDIEPPESIPLDRILADLESPAAPATWRAIAAAWRFRSGAPEGRASVLTALRTEAQRGWIDADPALSNPLLISSVLTLCRALYLYGEDIRNP